MKGQYRSMNRVAILVVSHKKFEIKFDSIYYPIFVGRKNFDTGLNFRDDQGESISEKNKNYCELTALYWYWKNQIDFAKVIGFCHYRRYFSKTWLTNSEKFFLGEYDILNILKSCDIILPMPWKLNCTVAYNYYEKGKGMKKDLNTVREVLMERYPEYLIEYDLYLESRKSSYCNMFITKAPLFEQYCIWLFDILFETEKRTDITGYTKEEARIYGYLSELLLNVWVKHNKLEVAYMPMVQNDIDGFTYLKRYMKRQILGC